MLNQKKLFKFLWGLIIALQLLVGRFYDERLYIFDINISVIIFILFIITNIIGLSIYEKKTISIYLQLFLFYASLLVISALYFDIFKDNISNEYGQTKLFEFIFITSVIVIVILFTEDIELLKNIILCMFGLSLLMLLVGYYVSFEKNFSFNDNSRLALLGGGPIVYARWIVLGVLYFIYMLNVKLIYKSIYFILGTILILFSGSKGPLIALILSIFCTYILSNLTSKVFFKALIIFAFSGLIIFFSLLYLNSKGYLPERMQQVTNSEKFSASTSVISRVERYPASIEIFKDNPLGVGIGNWAYFHNKYSQVKINLEDYPHNVFLETLNESGIVVFTIFLVILFTMFRNVYLFFKRYNKEHTLIDKKESISDSKKLINFFFSYFIFIFINSNISGDLSDNRFLFFAIASLFVLTSFKTNKFVDTESKIIENHK